MKEQKVERVRERGGNNEGTIMKKDACERLKGKCVCVGKRMYISTREMRRGVRRKPG